MPGPRCGPFGASLSRRNSLRESMGERESIPALDEFVIYFLDEFVIYFLAQC